MYKNIPSFLSWLQRWVLGTIYSHSAIYKGTDELGRMIEFEANLQVDQTTYHPDKKHRDVYEVVDVPGNVMKRVLNDIIDEYEEKTYGFISWFTILIRRIFEIIGFKNVKGWNILWGWGVICSELVWYYLYELSVYMTRSYGWYEFHQELKTYNPNIFTPKDISYLVEKYKLFTKQEAMR